MSEDNITFATPLQYLRGPPRGRGPPVEDLCYRLSSRGSSLFCPNVLEFMPMVNG